MNGYKAFYENKTADIYAETMAAASTKAREHFKPPKKKAHMVSVHLCELNATPDKPGEQVVHHADF